MRKIRSHERLREKYAAYLDLESRGLNFVQIAEALRVDRKELQKVKDAFDHGRSSPTDKAIGIKGRTSSKIQRQPAPPKPRVPWEEILRGKYPNFPDLVAHGLTRREIMRTLRIGNATLRGLKSAFGVTVCASPRAARPPKEYPGIEEALRRGGSYQSIGDEFGLCRERVRQIAKALGIKKAPTKTVQRKRTASGLTLYQQRLTEKYPDILNPSIVPHEVTGPSEITVYKIRHILGISFIASRITIKDRVSSVIDRQMSIPEILSAMGSVSMNTLHIYLLRLAKDGIIKRLSRGVYAPANWPAKDLP